MIKNYNLRKVNKTLPICQVYFTFFLAYFEKSTIFNKNYAK